MGAANLSHVSSRGPHFRCSITGCPLIVGTPPSACFFGGVCLLRAPAIRGETTQPREAALNCLDITSSLMENDCAYPLYTWRLVGVGGMEFFSLHAETHGYPEDDCLESGTFPRGSSGHAHGRMTTWSASGTHARWPWCRALPLTTFNILLNFI